MINPETLSREKLLFAYSIALEQGNFARLEEILARAAADPTLEDQIMAINVALTGPDLAQNQDTAPGVARSPDPSIWQRYFEPGPARPPAISIWQRLKAVWSAMRDKVWPVMWSVAALAGIVLLTLALVGPPTGNIFSNIMKNLPTSKDYQAIIVTPAPTAIAYARTPTAFVRSTQLAQAVQPMIVRNGKLILEASDTRAARQSVMALIAGYASEGAYVVSVNEMPNAGNTMPIIEMQMRVPVAHYDESIDRISALGTQVLRREETAQDVTQAYVDGAGRVEALEASRERLVQIIKEAKTIEDLLRAEQELAKRESELEVAKGSQQSLLQTSVLSSIALQLNPQPPVQPTMTPTVWPTVTPTVTPTPGWNPAKTTNNAVSVFLNQLQGFTDWLITFSIITLPWLLAAALLVYALWRAYRAIQRRLEK